MNGRQRSGFVKIVIGMCFIVPNFWIQAEFMLVIGCLLVFTGNADYWFGYDKEE